MISSLASGLWLVTAIFVGGVERPDEHYRAILPSFTRNCLDTNFGSAARGVLKSVAILNPSPDKKMLLAAYGGLNIRYCKSDCTMDASSRSDMGEFGMWFCRSIAILENFRDAFLKVSPACSSNTLSGRCRPAIFPYKRDGKGGVIHWISPNWGLSYDISPQLAFGAFAGGGDRFFSGPGGGPSLSNRVTGGFESEGNVENANSSYENSRAASDKHKESPIGHLPLGLKVVFAAPFFAVGFGIGYAALAIDGGAHRQIALRIFILLVGGLICALAFVLPFY
jgi:hypothetical protein